MTAEFARLLSEYIVGSEWNYSTLAAEVGAAGGYITHLLSGDINPGSERAEALMAALNVPPAEQALFLLLATGHSLETAQRVLGGVTATSGVLMAGERIQLVRDPRGEWGVVKHEER